MSVRSSSESGTSLVELLVALLLMLILTGTVFALVDPAQRTSQVQPEAMEMIQRGRVGASAMFQDLMVAGAGMYSGPALGALENYFAPIVPRKMGLTADPPTVARADAITLTCIPTTATQTTLSAALPPLGDAKVNTLAGCPAGKPLCGLAQGTEVVIFDQLGSFDRFTVSQVLAASVHLQYHGQSQLHTYATGAAIAEVETHTYYYDPVNLQLRHYDGYQSDVPVIDNVVGLTFSYFGDPQPPVAPKPPPGVENCLYDAAGNLRPMPVLAAQGGSLAPLPLAMLNDGPWCGAGGAQFDADLLRVRAVRVTLRVQMASDAFRGRTADFLKPGSATDSRRMVPDYVIAFDVSPRNLNLGR